MTHCPLSQLEEQSDQLEKLRRELEAKSGELVRVQQDLSRTEQVSCWPGWPPVGRDRRQGPLPRELGHASTLPGWFSGPSAILACGCDPARREHTGHGPWPSRSSHFGG